MLRWLFLGGSHRGAWRRAAPMLSSHASEAKAPGSPSLAGRRLRCLCLLFVSRPLNLLIRRASICEHRICCADRLTRPKRCVTGALWTNRNGVRSERCSGSVGEALWPLLARTSKASRDAARASTCVQRWLPALSAATWPSQHAVAAPCACTGLGPNTKPTAESAREPTDAAAAAARPRAARRAVRSRNLPPQARHT